MFKCTINVNSNTVAAVHRPVAKEGAEQLDDPQHYKMTPSIIRWPPALYGPLFLPNVRALTDAIILMQVLYCLQFVLRS